MTVSDLLIKLSIDGRGVTKGADTAISQFRRIGKAAAGMAAGFVSTAAIESAIRKTVDYAGKIKDMSDATGVSTDTLQKWEFAAEQTGASLETLTTAYRKLQQNMIAAVEGDQGKVDAFARMGVSIDDLTNKHPEEIFNQIAKGLKGVNVTARLTTDIIDLMGKSAADVLPAMRNGFAEATDQAERLGVVIDEKVISRLDDLGDRWDVFGKQARATFAPLLGGILEDMTVKLQFLRSSVSSFWDDVKADPSTLVNPVKMGAASGKAQVAGVKSVLDMYKPDEKQGGSWADMRRANDTRFPTGDKPATIDDSGKLAEKLVSNGGSQIPVDAMQRIGLHNGPVSQFKNLESVAKKQDDKLGKILSELKRHTTIAENDE